MDVWSKIICHSMLASAQGKDKHNSLKERERERARENNGESETVFCCVCESNGTHFSNFLK